MQKKTYTLLFNCSAKRLLHRKTNEVDELHMTKKLHDFQIQNAEM